MKKQIKSRSKIDFSKSKKFRVNLQGQGKIAFRNGKGEILVFKDGDILEMAEDLEHKFGKISDSIRKYLSESV